MKKYLKFFLADEEGSATPMVITMLTVYIVVMVGIIYSIYMFCGMIPAIATGVAFVVAAALALVMCHFRSTTPKK